MTFLEHGTSEMTPKHVKLFPLQLVGSVWQINKPVNILPLQLVR